MIDWTKPVRWVDDKKPAKVLARDLNGAAWVVVGEARAYLFDSGGKCQGVISLENTPEPVEPIAGWTVVWPDGHIDSGELEWASEMFRRNDLPALLKLTYAPGHASVEIIEERK